MPENNAPREAGRSDSDLFDLAPVPYATLDAKGVICEVNVLGADLLGADRRWLIGLPFNSCVTTGQRQRLADFIGQCRDSTDRCVCEIELLDRAGKVIPAQLTARSFRDLATEPVLRIAIVDLRTFREAERSSRESQEWLALAQSAAGAGAWEWDISEGHIFPSDNLYALYGIKPGSIEPRIDAWVALIHPDDRVRARRTIAAIEDIDILRFDYRLNVSGGDLRWMHSRARVLRDETGQAQRVIGLTWDVTDQKLAEQHSAALNVQLQVRTEQAEQQAEQLRVMAAALTQTEQRERHRLAQMLHDHIQQLLVAARMNVGVLRRLEENEEFLDILERTERLIADSITASRSLSVELSPPILNESGLAAGLDWLATWMLENHGLKVTTTTDAQADPQQHPIRLLLFEIVRELLFNVVKHARVDKAQVRMVRDAEGVRIDVDDRGIGFDSEAKTVDGGGRTGLGLASVKHRLEVLGGEMHVDSIRGHGTHIMLRAPITPSNDGQSADSLASGLELTKPLRADEPRPAREPLSSERIRVLLADDHAIVRQGLVMLLRDAPDIELVGEADTGRSAIEQTRSLQPDVVVMDVNMPDINGLAATHHINAEMPHVRIIGLSLHDEEHLAHAMLDAGAVDYLTKGGAADDLVACIRAAGGAEGRAAEE